MKDTDLRKHGRTRCDLGVEGERKHETEVKPWGGRKQCWSEGLKYTRNIITSDVYGNGTKGSNCAGGPTVPTASASILVCKGWELEVVSELQRFLRQKQELPAFPC